MCNLLLHQNLRIYVFSPLSRSSINIPQPWDYLSKSDRFQSGVTLIWKLTHFRFRFVSVQHFPVLLRKSAKSIVLTPIGILRVGQESVVEENMKVWAAFQTKIQIPRRNKSKKDFLRIHSDFRHFTRYPKTFLASFCTPSPQFGFRIGQYVRIHVANWLTMSEKPDFTSLSIFDCISIVIYKPPAKIFP